MLEFLLPDVSKLRLNSVDFHDKQIFLEIVVMQPHAYCPNCHSVSIRVHSHYIRTITDLPSGGFRAIIQLDIRRFFCGLKTCPKRTFTERIPSVVAHYARKTIRLAQAHSRIGFVVGGEAGSRISANLALSTSPDTLIRTVRAFPEPKTPPVSCLGVDDWAFRKGVSYGTILVDLESRRPIDLLSDRTADSLSKWLKLHPEIKIVSRDRFTAYIEGINKGAPQATQVTDRFHLLHNLVDAVERSLTKRYKDLQEAQPEPPQPLVELPSKPDLPSISHAEPALNAYEQQRQAIREKHRIQFEEVKRLHAEGVSIHEIGRRLHYSRGRIRRYLSHEDLPVYRRKRKRKILDPYWDYVQQGWESGCRKGVQLWRELQAKGYKGTYQSVALLIRPLRKSSPAQPKVTKKAKTKVETVTVNPRSPRQIAWLFVRPPEKLDEKQSAYLKMLGERSQECQSIYTLAQDFWAIVCEKKKSELKSWLNQAKQSGISEFRNFAFGLERDISAVEAALTFSWSNGPVEGHNNRLKMIKRQMYGRAGFDLLRLRVLYS
jgi:transposase